MADPRDAEIECLRALLARCIKYAREDRMVTPGVTRLARALAEGETLLAEISNAGGGEQRDASANPERVSVPSGASSAGPAPAEEAASTSWEEQAKSERKKARIISRRLDAILAARATASAVNESPTELPEGWTMPRTNSASEIAARIRKRLKDEPSVAQRVMDAIADICECGGSMKHDEHAEGCPLSTLAPSEPTSAVDESVCSHCDHGVIDVPDPSAAQVCPWCNGNYRAPPPAVDATVERLRAAVDVTLKAWDETYGPSESNEICEAMEILAAARRADEEVRRG